MIITRDEVKYFLKIEDEEEDLLINLLIPIAQDAIIDFIGVQFLNANKELVAETISIDGETRTISDSNSGFEFKAGQSVYVSGSLLNDGYYTIESATASALIMAEDTLLDESAGEEITITLVQWPPKIKIIAAQLVAYWKQARDPGVSNESIAGAISTSYSTDGTQIPEGIKAQLQKYKGARAF